MKTSVSCVLAVAILLSGAVAAGAIPIPAAPQVTVVGAAGTAQATYWVAAQDKAGMFTTCSPGVTVTNLPSKLDAANYARVQIAPVEGAAKYYVLKTMIVAKPDPVTIKVATPGDKTSYYWIVPMNGFRYGPLSGPYEAKCGDPQGNVLTWTLVNGASWYSVFRTDSATPPAGRFHCVVGHQLGMATNLRGNYGGGAPAPTATDPGALGFGVVGFPATDPTKPPLGDGEFLVATSAGEEVKDTGQALTFFEAVNVNETERVAMTQYAEGQPSTRTFKGAGVSGTTNLPNLSRPSFIAQLSEFEIDQNFISGGHSDYNAQGGWKSEIEALTVRQSSQTATQLAAASFVQENFGTGDTSNLVSWTTMHGSNKDGGDEGTGSYWGQVRRVLDEFDDTLTADAPRGAVALAVQKANYTAGTGRLLVNLSQVYKEGRIARVGGVDVHGMGTAWTAAMMGSWISFDVDTVNGHRMWYQITGVQSPTELTILARTGWSEKANLGYSRFIWDPATQPGPQPANAGEDAQYVLPKENEAGAKSGAYQICPGTLLGAPWRVGQTLNVEPLGQAWKAGDQVQVAPGPQIWAAMAYFRLWGDYSPQDYITGINLSNLGSRPTNTAGILIGNPGAANFRKGVEVYVARDGRGDGFVVSVANSWNERGDAAGNAGMYRGAFVAPVNLPALVDEYNLCPRLTFTRPAADLMQNTLSVQGPDKTPLMQFNWHDIAVTSPLTLGGPVTVKSTLTGSDQTRGKGVYSGDGVATKVTIKFAKAFGGEPFVTISTNQFARARLAEVTADHITVEFEQAPTAGTNNVVVYWMAQM
ncbi:MAG TPA: hypothetical protein VGM19_09930 [Armatimonadota bacterium]|jgi:hypothetical protein